MYKTKDKERKKKRRSWGSRRSSYRQRIRQQRSKQATVQMGLPGKVRDLCQICNWARTVTLPLSRFWPSCISGTSHAPCREVPSALLPVCSAVSPAYKNFSCSPSFFSSSFLFSFLVFRLVHQSKSQVSSQVRSRLPNQLGLTSALPLPRHTTKDLTKSMSWPALQSSGSLQSGESPKPTRLLIFLWFLTWKHKKE